MGRASEASSRGQPRPPTHLTEAPGHIHAKGIDSVPSVPGSLLEPDATGIR